MVVVEDRDHLAQDAFAATVDQVIGKNNCKGFVTDDWLRTQDCMPEPRRLWLTYINAGDICRHDFPDDPE